MGTVDIPVEEYVNGFGESELWGKVGVLRGRCPWELSTGKGKRYRELK
jgi:hypothetical protein